MSHKLNMKCRHAHEPVGTVVVGRRIYVIWYCGQTKATWRLPVGSYPKDPEATG